MIDKFIVFVLGIVVGAVALFVALAVYAWWRQKRSGI